MNLQWLRTILVAGIGMLGLVDAAVAASPPLAVLDRNGAWVRVEAYGANLVHVTIATDKALALAAPGYGINGEPEHALASFLRTPTGV